MRSSRSLYCGKRLSFGQILLAICLFGFSTIVSYLAVSWKLSLQWTPDIIYHPKTVSSYMIQPMHSSNLSISIMSNVVFLKDNNQTQIDNNMENQPSQKMINNEVSDNYVRLNNKRLFTKKTSHDEANQMHNKQKENKNGLQGSNTLSKSNGNDDRNMNNDINTQDTNTKNDALNSDINTSFHPEWGTINDAHLIIRNTSYDKSDFSFWWTDGDGSALFINATKYDKDGKSGYQSFVFCPIPKVGCSSWKQVMRRIKGIDAYLADDYWSLHHNIENGLEMDRIYRRNGSNIDVNAANKILKYIDPKTNKSIFHAAFVRDSIERSLSAFLEKCILSQWHERYWCRPQTNRRIRRYSHFDVFVEAIISKAERPQSLFLQRMSYWRLDYHWLPQNWMCDLYKLIDRYHIYDADNIIDRKNFFLNIGGNKSWNAIGATGWFQHRQKSLLRRRLQEKKKKKVFVIPHYRKYQYVDPVNNIRREHPPGYRGYKPGDILDISGSLLSENAAHSQNTRHKVYSYYRGDILGKLIVFYLDDYVLFKRHLPDWICSYINIEPVRQRIMSVLTIYKDWYQDKDGMGKKVLLQKEHKILFAVNEALHEGHSEHDILKGFDPDNLLTFGQTSIWHENMSEVERKNVTERKIQLENEFRNNTKMKCFYGLLLNVDQVYGTIFSVLRSTSWILDVLLSVNENILPKDGQCVITKEILMEKQKVLMKIMDVYLNEYIPYRLQLFEDEEENKLNLERAWVKVVNCLGLVLDDNDKMDFMELYIEWKEENKMIFYNILNNMIYTRDVPRNGRFSNNMQKRTKATDRAFTHKIKRFSRTNS